MSSCRFGRRSQCQGQRFAHPVFAFVETSPTEESSNESDTESFWSQLIDMLDEGILEFTRQMSLKEQEPKKESPKEKCGLRRNSIDPVNTFVHKRAGKFIVSVPLGKDSKPEDLNVSVKGRELLIEIKNERTSEDGSSRLSQVLTKKVALPDEVNVEEVKSSFTPEGVLKIEAPLPVPEKPAKPQAVEIPVNVEKVESSTVKTNAEVDIEFPMESSD